MTATDRERRAAAAARYRPAHIHCLLVAEAPPLALDRYFYFEDVRAHDSLFRYVAEGVLGAKPDRRGKRAALAALRDRGFFLTDLSEEPVPSGADLSTEVPGLVRRVVELNPNHIILIKVTVFDLVYPALERRGLPVVPARISFPGWGQVTHFQQGFAEALAQLPPTPPTPPG